MSGFERVADLLFEKRRTSHLIILFMTLLFIPGLPISLTPADIESYDLESPELTAGRVIEQEFSGNGVTVGYILTIRDSTFVNDSGPVDWEQIQPYSGLSAGVEEPPGGILNLSVLQELDRKAERVKSHEISEHLGPLVSEITGTPVDGVLSLPDNFRSFMRNETLLTQPSKEPQGIYIVDVPPKTNWTDCGELDCLQFDDPNITQAHIDLAAHRMANHSHQAFLRWLSNDFLLDFLWFPYGFPLVFLRCSYGFPMLSQQLDGFPTVFLRFSCGFPVFFLRCSYGCPMVFLWFSCGFPVVFLWLSYGFPVVFLWFSYGFPIVFLWFSCCFPMVFLWFSFCFPMVFL